MKIKHIQFTDKILDLVEETMSKKGYPTFTSVVHQAIIFFYDKNVNPPYMSGGETNPDIAKKKAVAKIEAKLEAEKYKTENKTNEKIAMCKDLYNGEIEGNICVFTSYGLKKEEDTEGRIPLEVLSKDIFENNVFFPNQDIVFKRRPDVAKIWEQKQ